MNHFLLILLSVFWGNSFSQPQKIVFTEEQKIDYLLACIEELTDAKFIRNGVSHQAYEAANHLRMKRKKAGQFVKTVDDFIKKVASNSSISGNPYKIIYNDGKIIEVRLFFYECLKKLEEAP